MKSPRYKRFPLGLLGLALMIVCACEQQALQSEREAVEMSLEVVDAEPFTKGIVSGTGLVDAVTGVRTLVVSAFLHAQCGRDSDYFVGETFAKNGDVWRRAGLPAFWPVGGSLDMMAYSSSSPFDVMDVTWGTTNSASLLGLVVDRSRTQDDILFGVMYGARVDDASGSGNICMYHSQAWLEFSLQMQAGNANVVVVDKVELVDAYLGGDLTVENYYGEARASWNMRRFTAGDAVVDDLSGVYGSVVTSVPVSVGMLVPQQEMCNIRVSYFVDGFGKSTVLELSHAYWLMGKHYKYEIVFDPQSEMFVVAGATVEPWTVGTSYSERI